MVDSNINNRTAVWKTKSRWRQQACTSCSVLSSDVSCRTEGDRESRITQTGLLPEER